MRIFANHQLEDKLRNEWGNFLARFLTRKVLNLFACLAYKSFSGFTAMLNNKIWI